MEQLFPHGTINSTDPLCHEARSLQCNRTASAPPVPCVSDENHHRILEKMCCCSSKQNFTLCFLSQTQSSSRIMAWAVYCERRYHGPWILPKYYVLDVSGSQCRWDLETVVEHRGRGIFIAGEKSRSHRFIKVERTSNMSSYQSIPTIPTVPHLHISWPPALSASCSSAQPSPSGEIFPYVQSELPLAQLIAVMFYIIALVPGKRGWPHLCLRRAVWNFLFWMVEYKKCLDSSVSSVSSLRWFMLSFWSS